MFTMYIIKKALDTIPGTWKREFIISGRLHMSALQFSLETDPSDQNMNHEMEVIVESCSVTKVLT